MVSFYPETTVFANLLKILSRTDLNYAIVGDMMRRRKTEKTGKMKNGSVVRVSWLKENVNKKRE